MEPWSDLDKIKYYRDEIRLEFNLLAMRSTILVTCQSFLVVPFAILQTAANFRAVIMPMYLITFLGVFVALILREPLNAAHRTIHKWLIKHRSLLKESKELEAFAIDRDMIPGVDKNPDRDTDHVKSLAFSVYGPWAFCLFWCAAIVWTTVRMIVGF